MTLAAGLAIAVGSINLIGMSSAAAATDPPTIGIQMPGQIGNGGDLQTGTITLGNPADGTEFTGFADIVITDAAHDLTAGDFVIDYNPGTGFTPLTLLNGANGSVTATVPGGVDLPAATSGDQIPLEVATNPGSPVTTITTSAYLDTTAGDPSTDVSSSSSESALSTPSISFADYPTALPGGGDYVAFEGTLENTTGSNYGGSNPAASPAPAGVRLDFSIASTASITPSDVTLDYCLNGTGESCVGGSWQNIPLTAGSGNTLTGFFGPAGGFVLPNNASNTTPFRIKSGVDAPKASLTTTVKLDKVNGSGAATGTDSSGVANGTITSVTEPAVAVQEPTMTFTLPSKLGNGGDLQAASATIDNTGGAARSGVRIDFHITPKSGTANLTPDEFIIEVKAQNGTYYSATLTSDGSGGVTGYAPPPTGFAIDANHSDTSDLLVGTQPNAPVGSVTFTANLDTTPGDTTTSIASYSQDTALTVPQVTFGSNYPKSISGGGPAPTYFTATLANSTGSNYGGTSATAAPTVAGIRPTVSIASSNATVTGSDVVLQYCAGATTVSCTGGTWTTIPLSGTGTLTGSFGPTGGLAVPNGAVDPIQFRAAVLHGTPTTALTPTVTLTKVDATTGASTGTDSTGVNNGTISSVTGAAIGVVTFANPTITATIKSAHARTAAGWYRSKVTITWHCTAGSAPLTTSCPHPVTVTGNTRGRVFLATIKASDGGTASTTVRIKLDHTRPTAKVTGAKNHHTYASRRHLKAHCHDSLSGIRSCKVTSHKHGHTVTWTIRATDKAGNVTTHKGKYKIR